MLRKHRGQLSQTARGRAVRHDPAALWWHLAERMPVRSADPFESQAGLLVLIVMAGGVPDDPSPIVAQLLDAIGWALADGTPPTPSQAFGAARETWEVLRRLGAIAGERWLPGAEAPTPDGVLLARAALQTWPEQQRR